MQGISNPIFKFSRKNARKRLRAAAIVVSVTMLAAERVVSARLDQGQRRDLSATEAGGQRSVRWILWKPAATIIGITIFPPGEGTGRLELVL